MVCNRCGMITDTAWNAFAYPIATHPRGYKVQRITVGIKVEIPCGSLVIEDGSKCHGNVECCQCDELPCNCQCHMPPLQIQCQKTHASWVCMRGHWATPESWVRVTGRWIRSWVPGAFHVRKCIPVYENREHEAVFGIRYWVRIWFRTLAARDFGNPEGWVLRWKPYSLNS